MDFTCKTYGYRSPLSNQVNNLSGTYFYWFPRGLLHLCEYSFLIMITSFRKQVITIKMTYKLL